MGDQDICRKRQKKKNTAGITVRIKHIFLCRVPKTRLKFRVSNTSSTVIFLRAFARSSSIMQRK